MITYFKGDVLKSNEVAILHGCNCQGVMGAGIARQIKDQYPKVFNEYYKRFVTHGLELGSVQYVAADNKLFINAMTQKNIGNGRQVSYDAIEHCLQKVNSDFLGSTIAMPKIGAGLGGGNWEIIEKIIEVTCPDIDVHVWEF